MNPHGRVERRGRIPRDCLGGGSRGEKEVGAHPWWLHGRGRRKKGVKVEKKRGSMAAAACEVTSGEMHKLFLE